MDFETPQPIHCLVEDRPVIEAQIDDFFESIRESIVELLNLNDFHATSNFKINLFNLEGDNNVYVLKYMNIVIAVTTLTRTDFNNISISFFVNIDHLIRLN